MNSGLRLAVFCLACLDLVAGTFVGAETPAGFAALFNGHNLAGWRGRPHLDPRQEAAGTPSERETRQKQWNDDLAAHWTVQDGVIVSDGHGVFLTTDRDYGDFELHVNWMLSAPCAYKPVGEWNTTRIRMVGEQVTVELNGQVVVDAAPLAKYFDKVKPLPATGPIQIQTHGAPMHVWNVFIEEL